MGTTSTTVDVTSAIRAFCAQQREWLELELQSEQDQQENQQKGGSKQQNNNNGKANNNTNELTTQVLSNLQVAEVSVGLYGRTVVRFELSPTTNSAGGTAAAASSLLLPAHRFTTGDEVEVRSKSHGSKSGSGSRSSNSNPDGVISQVTDSSISIALSSKRNDKNKKQRKENDNNNDNDDDNDDDDMLGIPPPFSLIPKSSAQVHKKMIIAIDELEKHGIDHPVAGRVVQALFDPPPITNRVPQNNTYASKYQQASSSLLDTSQLEAISFCLADDRPVSLIHGPPGTGKTTTVVSLIQQAVHVGKMKVLVVAPSNVAVDNVLARLVVPTATATATGNKQQQQSLRIRAIRLGHPARLQASILPYSLEALVQSADGTEIVSEVRKELQGYLRVLANPGSRGSVKRVAYQEMKSLRKEIRTREEKVVSELFASAQVVLATCVGADNRLLRNQIFDLVVIDEAAQALEAACWIPVLKAKRIVLAGDHCQLPPTIKSNVPRVQKGLGQTMFERLMDLYGDGKAGSANPSSEKGPGRVSRMLKVQYRMHESIANWASQALYGGELQTHASVQSRTLAQLTGRRTNRVGADGEEEADDDEFDGVAETALLLVDTAGCSMFESVNPAGSRFNEGEAQLVSRHVRTLLKMGVSQEQIAIITPYNGQVELLRSTLLPDFPKLEIRSVDGFQVCVFVVCLLFSCPPTPRSHFFIFRVASAMQLYLVWSEVVIVVGWPESVFLRTSGV
jgi:ATP-dependent RNA/DNA helicase IGHMBP2